MNNYNVLVMDDEEPIRIMMDAMLTRFILKTECYANIKKYFSDISVKCVGNSKEAIEEIESDTLYDLVFLGINLKEENIDGVDVLQRIKEIRPEQNVYMFTGYPISNENGKTIEKNALGVLHKPFKSYELFDIINQTMKKYA